MPLLTLLNVCYSIQNAKEAIDYMLQISLRTPADVGALIKDRRRSLGLDQAELARQIGVSRLWVNQVERGKPGASLGLILRAIAAVDVEIKGLINDQQVIGDPVISPDINAIVNKARK
jgi:HTH-type transcriptional regulator / antitoxin HipB